MKKTKKNMVGIFDYTKLLALSKSFFSSKYFMIVLVVVILDRLTKFFAFNNCPCVVGPILNIVRVSNTGIAFGMFKGQYSNIIFSLVTVLAIAFLIFLGKYKLTNEKVRLGITFMIGGAIGNLIDRLFMGYVLDIFSFHLSVWYFPAFNVADAFVTMGAFFAILFTFLDERVSSSEKAKLLSKPKLDGKMKKAKTLKKTTKGSKRKLKK